MTSSLIEYAVRERVRQPGGAYAHSITESHLRQLQTLISDQSNVMVRQRVFQRILVFVA